VYDKWQFTDVQALLAGISVSQSNALSSNSLWYWTKNGYDFNREANIDYEIDGTLNKNQNLTIHMSWERKQDFMPAIKIGLKYQHIWGISPEINTYNFDPDWFPVRSQLRIDTDQNAKNLSMIFKSDFKINNSLKNKIYFEYSKLLGNDNNFHKMFPSVRLNYRLTYQPVANFSLWAMFKYQSSVYWHSFGNIRQQSDGRYNASLPGIMRLDLAINKWLWKKRIKTSLLFNNLLNRKEIYHPIGASMDLRFFIQMEIYFNLLKLN
jgi:hypothetical protein